MKLKLAFASATAALACASAASAQDFSVNVGATSDYVFRGFSQTDENAAIQGGVDVTTDTGFYAGVWGSNVDFGDDTDAEYDVYIGVRGEAAGFSLDAGFIYYGYLNAPETTDYDYVELKGAVSHAVGPATIGVAAYYSPNFFGGAGSATYAEVNGSVSPISNLTLSGAYGNQDVEVGDGYSTWNVGATYAFSKFAVDLRYHDTDVENTPIAEGRVVAGVKATF